MYFIPELPRILNEIWDYIALDSLDSADRVIRNIYKAIQSLIATPNIGHRRPDLTSSPLRFWRIYDYLIAYTPDEYPHLRFYFSFLSSDRQFSRSATGPI